MTYRLDLVPLGQALAWEWQGNPKKHDLPKLMQALRKYGFQDPPKFDNSIPSEEGNGGIIGGNGRLLALQAMRQAGQPAPNGIEVDSCGEWLVPILFGNDLSTEAQAKAFGLDANTLTLAGGGFTDEEIAAIYEPAAYADLLRELQASDSLPVGLTPEGLSSLLGNTEDLEDWGHGADDIGEVSREITAETVKENQVQFTIGHHFSFKIPPDVYKEWQEDLRAEVGFNEKKVTREILTRLGLSHA